jgi:hypothetical protein
VAHLAEPAGAPGTRTRVVTMTTAGTAAWVPLVDRWPRVAAVVPEAPRELRESDDQHFEDGDSPGRCGDGGEVEAG